MSRSMAVFALALAAMLAMGAGDEARRTGDKWQDVGHAVRATANEQSTVEKALEKQVSVKLKGTPLKEAAAYLADLSGVNVLLDSKALADAGVAEDMPINFEMANVPLRTALDAMLAQHDLGYTIPDDNVLSITTAQREKEHFITRVYDVSNFGLAASPENEFGSRVIAPAPRSNTPNAGRSGNDVDSLVDLITGCIEPTSWSSSGGSGTIAPIDGRLVISQTREAQREVAELFADLDKINAGEKSGSSPTLLLLGSTPADDKIRERLEQRQDFSYGYARLRELVQSLRDQGITVAVNEKQLTDAGVSLEQPISFKAKHVPLKFALRTMLLQHELGYYVQDGVLRITTDAVVKEHIQIGVYPVRDLVSVGSGDSAADMDFDSLIDTITSTIAPTSWTDSGGPGPISVSTDPPALVIGQTEEIQEQIGDLLGKLRATKHGAKESTTTKKPAQAKDAMVVRVHHIPGREDAALDQYIAVIRKLIEPNNWSEGTSYIGKLPGAIIVRHTPAVQRRIDNLIAEVEGTGGGGGGLGGGGFGASGLSGGGAFQVAPEAPAGSRKGAVHAPADKVEATSGEVEQTPVQRALDKPIEFEFIETPLKDVAADLAKKRGINIVLDEKAIADAGGALDIPITCSFVGVPLELALHLTLKEHELNFLEIDDNVLQITSDVRAKESVVSRTYDVHDLAVAAPKANGAETPLKGLVDLLSNVVASPTWAQHGGTGTIAVFDNQLIVSQTNEIQEQIIDLLAALRQARDKPERYRNGGGARPVTEAKMQKWFSEISKPKGKTEKPSDDGRRARPERLGEAEMRKLLDTRQDFDYVEIPLKDMIDALKNRHRVEIQLDAKAITDAGGSLDMPITFGAKNMRLETALKLMLQPHELGCIIEYEVLLITSEVVAKERIFTRLYSVGDLVPDSPPESTTERATYDKLIGAITSTVSPNTWQAVGGNGTIQPFPLVRVLVCNQSQEAHEEVAKILAMLRAHRSARPARASTQTKAKGANVTAAPARAQ